MIFNKLRKWLIKKLGGYVTQSVNTVRVAERKSGIPVYASIEIPHMILNDDLWDVRKREEYVKEQLMHQIAEQLYQYAEIESCERFDHPAKVFTAKIAVIDPKE